MLSPHLFQWLFEYAFVQAEIIKQLVVFEKCEEMRLLSQALSSHILFTCVK